MDINTNNIEKKKKTPDYTKRAIANYRRNKETITVLLDAGTKDRIKAKHGDISINSYVKQLIKNDLDNNSKDILPF